MSVTVIYNPKSGTTGGLDDIKKAFAAQDIQPTYLPVTSKLLHRQLKTELTNPRAIIVAAGGDGTVSTVASFVHGSKAKLGIIPSGTLNHFAKDAGIPLGIEEAVKLVAHGSAKKVDAAMVNKKIFVNNASIGLYPLSLRTRAQYDGQIGKWPAALVGAIKVLAHPRRYHVELAIDGKKIVRRTPFVFIGNNSYHFNQPPFLRRPKLDTGLLSVTVVKAHSPLAVIHLFIKTLFTKKRRTAEFETYNVASFRLYTRHHRSLHVAYDGEVTTLKTPLVYTSLPGALRVIMP